MRSYRVNSLMEICMVKVGTHSLMATFTKEKCIKASSTVQALTRQNNSA